MTVTRRPACARRSAAESPRAPTPTGTAETVTAPPTGRWALATGAIVRTIGGAATTDGEATADGPACTAGEGDGSGRKLGANVGGTPADVDCGGASVLGTAPRTGRSIAGPQLSSSTSRPASTADWRRIAAESNHLRCDP